MSITRPSLLLITLLLALVHFAPAQVPSGTPRQEKLLNGMKVLIWNVPGREKVSLKLRIHAGAAFDPQDKEGVMQLLSKSLFPTPESREFFREELGGGIDVTCGYDYIQIDGSSDPAHFLTLMETIAQSISNIDLSKESTAPLKAALIEKVRDKEKDVAYVADQAVSRRLFGSFPYGRPALGSSESLPKVDFADLRFAKDRFLTADNATVLISGDLDAALVFRAARRYFGAWQKSDKKVPSTFRQPDAPGAEIVKVEVPGAAASEVRYAVRGFSRSSKEFAAAEVYARVLQSRLADLIVKSSGSAASVVHAEHVLPGSFVFGYRSQAPSSSALSPVSDTAAAFVRSILSRPVTEAEFSSAKTEVAAAAAKRDAADLWLDVDTFHITSPADEARSFQNVTLADVNALSSKLAAEPVAAVVVSPPAASTTN